MNILLSAFDCPSVEWVKHEIENMIPSSTVSIVQLAPFLADKSMNNPRAIYDTMEFCSSTKFDLVIFASNCGRIHNAFLDTIQFIHSTLLRNYIPVICIFLNEPDPQDGSNSPSNTGWWCEEFQSQIQSKGIDTQFILSGTLTPLSKHPNFREVCAPFVEETKKNLLHLVTRAVAEVPPCNIIRGDVIAHFCLCIREMARLRNTDFKIEVFPAEEGDKSRVKVEWNGEESVFTF